MVPWFVFSNILLTAFWVICFVFFGDPGFSHWSISLLVFQCGLSFSGVSFHLASGLFIGFGSHRHDLRSSCALFGIPLPFGFLHRLHHNFPVAPSPISFGQHTPHSFLCYRNRFRFCTIPTIVPSEPIHIPSYVCHIQNCSSLYSIIESLPVHRNLCFPSPYSSTLTPLSLVN